MNVHSERFPLFVQQLQLFYEFVTTMLNLSKLGRWALLCDLKKKLVTVRVEFFIFIEYQIKNTQILAESCQKTSKTTLPSNVTKTC